MAVISKDDVQTYVRKLISKEIESINNENKALSDNRKLNKGEHRNRQNRSVRNSSLNGRMMCNKEKQR